MNNIKNNNLKSKRTSKKKKRNIYYYADIIIIILLILIIFIFVKNNKSSNKNNDKKQEKEEIINTMNNTEIEEFTKNIKKIDFYKEENKDRYIKYKEQNPELSYEMVVVYVNIGLDKKFYENIVNSPNKDTNIVLANKLYFLGEDYVPKDLEKISSSYSSGEKYLEKNAKIAFEKMAKDAKKEGYNIRAVSTYRSYSYQKKLYSNYAASDGVEKADTYSARPGFSEHQTGLAVDVDNTKTSYTKFGNTKEFSWMKENAYKYGFILRYTKENEFITGYMNEPWHYRYVGIDIAKYIQENPMTFEEYFVRFLDK